MNRMQLVMWIALAIAIIIPVYFWRRSREVISGFDQLIAERHFAARASSPVAAFTDKDSPLGLHFLAAYDGALRPPVPVTLLLLRRTEPVLVKGVPMPNSTIYVGAYLPPTLKLGESWLRSWEERAARKQGDVVYAARVAEGGVAIVWQGAPTRGNVAKHLDALGDSLSGS